LTGGAYRKAAAEGTPGSPLVAMMFAAGLFQKTCDT